MTNGLPIGACLIRDKFCDLFTPGSHGSTFGGNPLSSTAALVTLKEIIKNELWNNAAKQGAYLLDELQQKFANHKNIKEIRGKGLMIGVELDRPCRDILPIAVKHGLIFNVTRENTLRFLPPIIITKDEVENIMEKITKIITEYFV